jgi:ring-1,2-phenylacetyl-CoA epoxidase subunit PaaC
MSFDNVLGAITEDNDEARWAFGTGFHDPLAGIDTAVPAGIDPAALTAYCLMLGDDALVLSHRLQEWCTRAPELEEEVALANIALDLLGQARLLLARAGQVEGDGRGEDDFAYLRDAAEFRNVRLVEEPNGDFAFSIVRLLMFATWRLALLDRLTDSGDPVIAAIAAKGVKEVAYHREHAAMWTVRLGDGTDESRRRMLAALAAAWPLAGELFRTHEVERAMAEAGVGVDPATVRAEFDAVLAEVLAAATLPLPSEGSVAGTESAVTESVAETESAVTESAVTESAVTALGGRAGAHTPALTQLLAELQVVARAHPGATW